MIKVVNSGGVSDVVQMHAHVMSLCVGTHCVLVHHSVKVVHISIVASCGQALACNECTDDIDDCNNENDGGEYGN